MRLIGEANESEIILEGRVVKALIDSGAQISTITDHFARELRLEVKDVGTLLNLEGTGGGEVPYSGYVEANLKIPSMPNFSRDILLLVVPNSRYGERVPTPTPISTFSCRNQIVTGFDTGFSASV